MARFCLMSQKGSLRQTGRASAQNTACCLPEAKWSLDEVLTGIEKLYYKDELQYIDLGIYLISHFDSENETLSYALLAEDGSWVSEFEYEELVPMSIGVLGIYDKEKNLARIIDSDGNEIVDTKNFLPKSMLLPYPLRA